MERRIVDLRLLGPFAAAVCLMGAVLFALLYVWADHADVAERMREETLVTNANRGNSRRIEAAIAPMVNADEAVRRLDNRFDPKWAETYLDEMQASSGFSKAVVIDGDGRILIAAQNDHTVPPEVMAPLVRAAAPLAAAVRRAESQRGPFIGVSASGDSISYPIQFNAVTLVDGAPYLLMASLIQPGRGLALPKGERAPIVLIGGPLDSAAMALLADRYLLSGLRAQIGEGPRLRRAAHVVLTDADDAASVALVWSPSRPGTDYFHKALAPVGLVLLGLAACLYWMMAKSRAATQRLAGSEARLELALSTAKAGAFEINNTDRTFWCSPRMTEILGRGMTYEEASQPPWPCVHPDDVEGILERANAPVAAGVRQNEDEFRIVRPDGEVRWIRVSLLGDAATWGECRRLTGLILDIDERKREEIALVEARRAAQEAGEAKSRFLATVSHEIRTPMNGILGVLHLLKGQKLSRDGAELVNEALACGEMLTGLIGDILDFSKIEAGRLELENAPTDPVAALQGVVSLLQPQCEAKGITLETAAPADMGWTMVDPVRLRQCLFNLIGNAVKFTAQGGVHVRLAAQDGERMRFEIADTGIGIPEEVQGAMFEPFHQGDSSTTRRFGGTGLGLSITRRLARLMGGDVGFESRRGEGSTFWLELPAPPATAPAKAEAAPFRPLGDLRVLVVEDNPTNRLIATRLLESMGMSVETAENGELGVTAAARGGFDLILMDVQMPVMDGLEATRLIRAMGGPTARTPIIALTANTMTHQRDSYLAAGIDGVVGKPISPAALLVEIVRLTAAADGTEQAALAS